MNIKKQISILNFLNSKLQNIPVAYSVILHKLCGGSKVVDLLFYRPLSYIDRSKSLLVAKTGDFTTFIAKVFEHQPPAFNGPYRVVVKSENHYLFIVFFHYSIQYLHKLFPVGSDVIVSGRLEKFVKYWQIIHPEYISLNIGKFEEIAVIEPIYQLCRSVTNKKIRKIISSNLRYLSDLPEWIDKKLIKKKRWLSWKESVIGLHRPNSLSEAEVCRERLAYDELFAYQLALNLVRKNNAKSFERKFLLSNRYKEQVLNRLQFQLTNDQIQAIDEISERQKSEYRMLSLLQGEVGSGKTVVVLFAILNAVENNMQAALMAPTTILAEQHYNWIRETLSCTNIKVSLLTSKTTSKERNSIISELINGILNIVIGTHALFQASIIFKNLGLIVIDEQQRFGVMQRNLLIEKGSNTDILFVTATPIPRTLQQAMYGDIKCSFLREKPKSRFPVKTVIINMKRILDVIQKLKEAIIDRGEKAYWICPYVEKKEELNITGVETRFQELQKIFFDRVGLIHGKLTQDQKDRVMFSFKNEKISLLVATSIVEIGIDVPDATIIVVENAEQFGLLQLHQLRGRVGRSNRPSFCLLLRGNLTKGSSLKLKIMCESQDGFYIAEKDMFLRGSGDILGTKQSGYKEFKFADFYKDRKLLKLACNNAKVKVNNFEPLLNIFQYQARLHFKM